MSSSDDEGGFGDLFAGADIPEPEYPIETLVVDRLVLAREGSTNTGFTPLYDRFDVPPTASTKAAGSHRLDAAAPAPLQVKYRNKRHSLWGHRLWNAAKYMTKRMDEGAIDVVGKSVLELGAGLGVPTLSAYRNGARLAVVTDYPDADLMDIIRLNVTENCTPDLIDADAVQRLAALSGDGAAAPVTQCLAEPLLWGSKSHIDTVMQYTPGKSGFDVLILSDILFNHVCNDDLADTVFQMMARTPTAAAYCVFSHHRAFKELNDYEFFDKCVARGMCYEQVDEEAYPMMFPEDRGPESVRMPVKCFRITHRLDKAGPAVNALPSQSVFDVVIQGSGMVQSYLSAALARSGIKVLHCDGAALYGGPFSTLTLAQFRQALTCEADASVQDDPTAASARAPPLLDGRLLNDRVESLIEASALRQFAIDVFPTTYMADGEALQSLVAANMVRTVEFQRVARFLFLTPHDSSQSQSHNNNNNNNNGAAAGPALKEVPLTRGSVFATDLMSLLDKRRLMKFVKDVEASLAETLHAKTANPADDPHYSGVGSNTVQAREKADAFLERVIGQAPPQTTLRALLQDKYGVSPAGLDVMTLLGELDLSARDVVVRDGEATSQETAALAQSVQLVRQLLTSVGMFNSATPFLLPCYGASELPQSLCRTAAVWGATFMLQRSLHHVVLNEETEKQHAVLSNGQAVRSRVVVIPTETAARVPIRLADWEHTWLRAIAMKKHGEAHPAELCWRVPCAAAAVDTTAEGGEEVVAAPIRYARAVVVATAPLFSWQQLVAHGVAAARPDVDLEGAPPVLVVLVRVPKTGTDAVVHVVQHSAGSEQAPEDGASVVVHFTADAAQLSEADLVAFVQRTFLAQSASDAETATPGTFGWATPEQTVALFASFTLDACAAAEASNVPDADVVDPASETWRTDDFALQECVKLSSATRHDRARLFHAADGDHPDNNNNNNNAEAAAAHGAGGVALTAASLEAALRAEWDSTPRALPSWAGVLSVPTLRQHPLYDGQYVAIAARAYDMVLEKLGRAGEGMQFLERQPDNGAGNE